MDVLLQQIINGLVLGSMYALIALGYTMVYGVLKLINFAHGDLFTLGAYLGFSLLVSSGLAGHVPIVLAIVIVAALVMGLVGLVGVALERVAYRPLRRSDRLAAVVSALGASIFFQNAIMLAYEARSEVYPIMDASQVLHLGDTSLHVGRILMFLASLGLMLVLYWFINRTRLGTAIRATAIDQDAARLMGIDVNRIISIVFFIGPALGGAAGVMVGLYYTQINYTMSWVYGLKAFTAAILGGIGNIPGAMLGGLLLGVIEALGAAYISIAWKDAIAFLVLICILIFRPTGILGEKTADKI